MANQVVNEKRCSGEETMVFKIDFQKSLGSCGVGFFKSCLKEKRFCSEMDILDLWMLINNYF